MAWRSNATKNGMEMSKLSKISKARFFDPREAWSLIHTLYGTSLAQTNHCHYLHLCIQKLKWFTLFASNANTQMEGSQALG